MLEGFWGESNEKVDLFGAMFFWRCLALKHLPIIGILKKSKSIGDGSRSEDKGMKATIAGIEMFHKTLDEGQSGDQRGGSKTTSSSHHLVVL